MRFKSSERRNSTRVTFFSEETDCHQIFFTFKPCLQHKIARHLVLVVKGYQFIFKINKQVSVYTTILLRPVAQTKLLWASALFDY